MTTRRERRWQLRQAGMLKVKNMYGAMSEIGQMWYNKTRTEGAKIHQENTIRNEKRTSEFLSQKEASIAESHRAHGYSEEQIKLMLEGWALTVIKDPETYRADRKEAQRLFNQARSLNK